MCPVIDSSSDFCIGKVMGKRYGPGNEAGNEEGCDCVFVYVCVCMCV